MEDQAVTIETDTMEGSMATLLTSCFTWCTLYFVLCLMNPRRSYEWHIRSVTVVHAITVTLLCAWCGIVQGPWPFTEAGGPSTPLQQFTMTLCLGYFLFDFSWCLYFKTEGPVMLLHHSLSIFGLGVSVANGMYGTEMTATILGAEITNPLLQWRWFLRETGKYHTLLGEIVDHAFMIGFGVFRLGIGSYLLYCYYQQPTDFLGRLGGTLIYSIGWIFWISIVQYAIKKYRKKFLAWKKRKEESGVMRIGKTTADNKNGSVSATDNRNGSFCDAILTGGKLSNGHLRNGYMKERLEKRVD